MFTTRTEAREHEQAELTVDLEQHPDAAELRATLDALLRDARLEGVRVVDVHVTSRPTPPAWRPAVAV